MGLLAEVVRDRQADALEALTEVAKALATPLDLPELLEAVMRTIGRVLAPADIGAIMLWDHPAGVFRPAAALGYDPEILKDIGLRSGESITGKVFDDGHACLLAAPDDVERAMADLRPFNREVLARSIGHSGLPCSAVAAPIVAGEHRFGVLILESLDPLTPFRPESLAFVQTLADLVALAIDRERLAQRADAVREARRAERTRSEALATLSHELRMPLSTIKGYATAMLMDELSWSEAKHREFLQLIEEACDDMEGMVRDILDASLIDVEQLKLERQPIRLPALAREIAGEVQHRSGQHQLVVDFPADFPLLQADPRWIRQVLRNILDNAVKYSPDGGLIVLRGEPRRADVVVSVADQGIGISSEDVIPLFEKYFRVRSLSTLYVPGTGLGLPIARAIVEAHGGRIWVESKEGEGTTILFSLPRDPGTEAIE
jgi:K+-sensing histidine kinase KdpD